MPRFLLILLTFTLFTAEKCKNESSSVVEIQFTKTNSYCGGAAPSDLMLKNIATPHPFNGTMLYLYDKNIMCIDSFYAKDDSTYKTAVPIGEYTIRLVPEMKLIDGDKESTKNCVIEYKQRVLKTISIASDTAILVNLHFDCNPCYPPPP